MPGHPTILLVDDYEDALEVWGLYLRHAGFDVLTAADGPSALRMATELQPDLVVLDLGLPGRSGSEVAQMLRAQQTTRAIPLIAATGYSQAAQIAQARRCGFDAMLIKPCEPELLISEIRRLLVQRSAPVFTVDGKAAAL